MPQPEGPPSTLAEVRPVTVEAKVRVEAVAVPEPGGGYSVVVPALPGCLTQGADLDEVRANLIEAAEGWLAVAHDREKDQAVRDLLP